MDPVSRRRRNPPASEQEPADPDRDQFFQAALSQAGVAGTFPTGLLNSDASPNTMEKGVALNTSVSEQLPVASPFHSERVKTEVELMRSRPNTLDDDGLRLQQEVDETALGDLAQELGTREPDYTALGSAENPRVARVEPSAGGAVEVIDTGLEWKPPKEPGEPSGKGRGATSPASSANQLGVEEQRVGPTRSDPRELVPEEESRMQRMETLLVQFAEENRELKRRLQTTESQSSWHSQLTRGTHPEGGPPFSPVSFTMGQSNPEVFPGPLGAVQAVNFNAMSDFPGAYGDPRLNQGLEGRIRSSQPGPPLPFPPVPFEPPGFSRDKGIPWTGGVEGRYDGLVFRGPGFHGPAPLPLPAPTPPTSESCAAGPQTLRQFAAEALSGGSGQGDQGSFQTPRSRVGDHGLPVSPGGTVIRPPPGPPPLSPRSVAAVSPVMTPAIGQPSIGTGASGGVDSRPEEPAKYISELPKLPQADLSSSAVVCGNWLAQIKQIFMGLSPSADVWYSSVELAANQGYSQWLVADPLGRLSLDPSSVVALFDVHKFQRVESRAVTLLLAAVPNSVRDDIITNRWLSYCFNHVSNFMCLSTGWV